MGKFRPILFIYAKDVQLFTRKSIEHANWTIRKIKAEVGKGRYQPLTVSEFCRYMKLDEDYVYKMLGYE